MLALMVVLVFGNVVLRYAFNSGLVFSEEVSRFLFMWLTLMGALLVMKDRGHLGMMMVVRTMGIRGRRVSRFLSDLGSLICCALLADGAWRLFIIVLNEHSSVTGISMGWVYASLLVCSVGMCLLLLVSIFRQLTGQLSDEELDPVDSSAGE
jgi:TRAP-type C4-dicarboxylate transport system permease small subunit